MKKVISLELKNEKVLFLIFIYFAALGFLNEVKGQTDCITGKSPKEIFQMLMTIFDHAKILTYT